MITIQTKYIETEQCASYLTDMESYADFDRTLDVVIKLFTHEMEYVIIKDFAAQTVIEIKIISGEICKHYLLDIY